MGYNSWGHKQSDTTEQLTLQMLEMSFGVTLHINFPNIYQSTRLSNLFFFSDFSFVLAYLFFLTYLLLSFFLISFLLGNCPLHLNF